MFRDKPLVNQEEKIPIFVQALVQTLIVETKENQKIPSSFVSCTVDACIRAYFILPVNPYLELLNRVLHLNMYTESYTSFFSILLTHKGSHREAYRDFQPSLTSSGDGAKGCSDHRFRAPPAYTAQLPTLHQHRANNQYRTTNQI